METTPIPTNWWMDKQKWSIHTMEYYSSIKRNEIIIGADVNHTWKY